MRSALLAAALLAAVPVMGAAAVKTPTPVSNGLALTPPMGRSSWNQFGDDINEAIVTQTIDAMVANGMRDAGYVFVNLDDGWQPYKGARRDHPLEFDPVKFPRGISYLAEYAHARGMKLGIYSGPGQTTCAGYTGSIGNEAHDAAMFASWGVDHGSGAFRRTVFGRSTKSRSVRIPGPPDRSNAEVGRTCAIG